MLKKLIAFVAFVATAVAYYFHRRSNGPRSKDWTYAGGSKSSSNSAGATAASASQPGVKS